MIVIIYIQSCVWFSSSNYILHYIV